MSVCLFVRPVLSCPPFYFFKNIFSLSSVSFSMSLFLCLLFCVFPFQFDNGTNIILSWKVIDTFHVFFLCFPFLDCHALTHWNVTLLLLAGGRLFFCRQHIMRPIWTHYTANKSSIMSSKRAHKGLHYKLPPSSHPIGVAYYFCRPKANLARSCLKPVYFEKFIMALFNKIDSKREVKFTSSAWKHISPAWKRYYSFRREIYGNLINLRGFGGKALANKL